MWKNLPETFRFLIIGGINFLISYLIFVIALKFWGKHMYQLCVVLQWGISSIFSYLNQKFFVFFTKGNYIREYIKCFSTWIVGYLLNAIILEAFVIFGLKNIYIGQIFAIFIVSLLTYIIFKKFAFRNNN